MFHFWRFGCGVESKHSKFDGVSIAALIQGSANPFDIFQLIFYIEINRVFDLYDDSRGLLYTSRGIPQNNIEATTSREFRMRAARALGSSFAQRLCYGGF